MNSFFFFKALGFVITPQSVVVAVSGAEPHSYSVQACLGPRGLTRLAVQLMSAGRRSQGPGGLLSGTATRICSAVRRVPPLLYEFDPLARTLR